MAFHPNDLSEKVMIALERYAAVTHTQVIKNQSQLDLEDKVMDEMISWCRGKKNLVVLKSGNILSTDPTSRQVQNCKSLMLTKGIYPGLVFAATDPVIAGLLGIQLEEKKIDKPFETSSAALSEQQKLLRELLGEALRRNVSQIHIQVRQTSTQIRMRQRGELQRFGEWSDKLGRDLSFLLFNKETDQGTAHFNPFLPQETSLSLNLEGKDLRLLVKRVPVHGGFDLALRIQMTREEPRLRLEELGFTSQQAEIMKVALTLPSGAILIAGPSDSGKSTTLAACLGQIQETEKLYSLEDARENVIERATQIQLHSDKADRSFASLSPLVLRMDPDVISLDDIHDEERARLLMSAALSGQLVVCTLQAGRALSIITRLRDLGLSPSLLSDNATLCCLVCQHLAVKLCSHCGIPLLQSKDHEAKRAVWEEALGPARIQKARVRGAGCSQCHYSGMDGRIAVAEVIYIDEEGRKFILKEDLFGWEAYLESKGFQTLYDRVLDLIEKGLIDPFDAEKVVGPLQPGFHSKSYLYK